jgi:hypothetical protein
MTSNRNRFVIVALALAVCAGCQPDEIRTYQVGKAEMTRLLGAILPHDDSTWFIKMSGPASAVAGHDKEFTVFLQSLHFKDGGDKPLAWELPTGWKLDKANRQGRYATIFVGEKDALELSITKLSREGQASSVLANVNRWRNQLALPPVTEDELRSDIKELKAEAGTITVVDLTGAGSGKTGAKAPFAGGDRMPPAVVKEQKSDIGYRMPEGWKPSRGNSISKVAFEVQGNDKTAQITVTPLGGAAGGLDENVNRWREQVGLQRVSAAEVQKLVHDIPVDGKTGQYVDLVGATRRILAVIVPGDGTTWFVKMDGATDLVGQQKSKFEEFVKSLRFTAE